MNKFKFFIVFLILSLVFLQNEYAFGSSLNEELSYYSVEYDNAKTFKESIKQKNIELTYKIPEIHTAQIKTSKSKLNSLIKSNKNIKFVNPTCSTCVVEKSVKAGKNLNNKENGSHDLFDRQWDMRKITNEGKSYKLSPDRKKAKVALVDSGVNSSHTDLKSINKIVNEVPKNGFRGSENDESGNKNFEEDKLNHGTLVAGQIGANGNLKGVNPGVEMNVYRVFGSKKSEMLWVSKGIIDAANDDNDVINVSLGNYLIKDNQNKKKLRDDEKVDYDALQKAINYAQKKGSIVVAAVGNDGINVKKVKEINKKRNLNSKTSKKVYDSPANLNNVMTVGSIDDNDYISEFSNYGNNFIDLMTIGGSYKLLDKYGKDAWLEKGYMQKQSVLSTSSNGRYIYQSGTSLAAPKVSGALALEIDKYQLKDQPETAIELFKKKGIEKEKYMDKKHYGNGKLDVYKLLKE
ncbi:S8 family serine peptidase [Staphylococcus epidermidis]|jgi:epidermin leader peptide-processing serine protease epiP|uniref:S8 family peptidase n=1 Tax=Bacillota TaxID=1239 RepID=UPI00026C1FE9|nr:MULTISPECIES: S8 family serine peptidase [Bacillota]EJD97732.1 putative epidermin leader peptide-processing serine protease EpiP [Staphylococcus epidermidis NIHLM040]MBM0752528.1 peptidase S8 [Staphylococcus epidermidis]MBM0765226.1 peptidase S8 [Staphylococcus epidermidis]MBM0787174.1 peptidase S8 [Staphylococcus epidermidis]MBM0789501.1 peptidase S8 [Staphylococcus epidermidis]